MIFYFSATGNSKYVAMQLAKATEDVVYSIVEELKQNTCNYTVQDGERVGIVCPIYFWGLPTIVLDFISRLKLDYTNRPYIYSVMTFGTSTGQANYMMRKALKEKGIHIDGRFVVRMVDNYTPMFNLSDKDKCKRITEAAEPYIKNVCNMITERKQGIFDNRRLPHFISQLEYLLYDGNRKTQHFWVKDNCIGCKLCAKKCPANAIEIHDSRPIWTKEQCILCLGCLHRCPTFSIQYGKNTVKHGQFINPNVKV